MILLKPALLVDGPSAASTVLTMVWRASSGYLPEAVSPERMTQEVPQRRLPHRRPRAGGPGDCRIMESSIWWQ